MDRYQRVEKPRAETPIAENEIRITSQGRMRNYITYAMTLLQEKEAEQIVFKAMGRAINKAVTIVELIKRRIVGLHQITSITSADVIDTYEPLEEGLLPLENTRHVSMITVTLSKKELNTKNVGYQMPIPKEQVKVVMETYYEERSPTGRGRGRHGGRGRGGPRGLSGNDYAEAGYDGGGYDRNQNYIRGSTRGRSQNFRGSGKGYEGPQYDTQQDSGYEAPAQGRGRGRDFHGRGRGVYDNKQFHAQQDDGYNNEASYRSRGRGRNFRDHGRGGYNGPQQDDIVDYEVPYQNHGRGRNFREHGRGYNGPHQVGGADHEIPFHNRGRGRNFREHGRGGYNGPQQDGGTDYEAPYGAPSQGHGFHGRGGRGGYNGPPQGGGYDYDAPSYGQGVGRDFHGRGNFRGRGRGGYNGPQYYDTQRDGDYNYEPHRGRGTAFRTLDTVSFSCNVSFEMLRT
ncbi:hypothetical protein DM860_013367 [Cuscuta australis]|uniref:DNA/RNA-binding protein Alba-like domain-containing protein n=1 Tax=Cuscuta australis TaxID=267555 RepID=A0A328DNZ7_9ASTE|nr:hypothetical protein DM860_013367 [Cuscuta australis]